MQDLGPAAMVNFLDVLGIISNVFKRHGARSVETSHLQVRGGQEMFYGSFADKIVNIDDPGGGGGGERESLCLRYDLTVSPFPFIGSFFVCTSCACKLHYSTYRSTRMYICPLFNMH